MISLSINSFMLHQNYYCSWAHVVIHMYIIFNYSAYVHIYSRYLYFVQLQLLGCCYACNVQVYKFRTKRCTRLHQSLLQAGEEMLSTGHRSPVPQNFTQFIQILCTSFLSGPVHSEQMSCVISTENNKYSKQTFTNAHKICIEQIVSIYIPKYSKMEKFPENK